MILGKLVLLIFILLVVCAFACGLLLRLQRTAQRLVELQQQLAANSREAQLKLATLERQRAEMEARQAAAAKSPE